MSGARYNYIGADLSIFDNDDARLVILRRLLGIPKKLAFMGSIDWIDDAGPAFAQGYGGQGNRFRFG
jgi:hypothetical protein